MGESFEYLMYLRSNRDSLRKTQPMEVDPAILEQRCVKTEKRRLLSRIWPQVLYL